jgi:hypothetical protein
MAQLASNRYLVVHSLPKEDRYDTDDTSAEQIHEIFVSKSSLSALQSAQGRQHCLLGCMRRRATPKPPE